MGTDQELAKIWSKIPDDTQVLITHGPAYYCNDLVKHAYGRDPHVGSQSLANRKLELQGTLKAHISGHIHEQHGTIGTNPINVCASVLDDNYRLTYEPIILEII